MRAWVILVFVLIFNVTLSAVNAVPLSTGSGNLFYSANVAPYGNNASNIQSSLGCTTYSNGSMDCTPVTPNANILSIAGVFGDFIDALHMLIQIAAGVILPYYFVQHYLGLIGVGGTFVVSLAAIFNMGMWVDYGALYMYFVSARDPEGIS